MKYCREEARRKAKGNMAMRRHGRKAKGNIFMRRRGLKAKGILPWGGAAAMPNEYCQGGVAARPKEYFLLDASEGCSTQWSSNIASKHHTTINRFVGHPSSSLVHWP
jgi:hypothetical protein